ncbi:MAG: hypothetical protein AB7N76_13510 [Planctomycetota bacterium]
MSAPPPPGGAPQGLDAEDLERLGGAVVVLPLGVRRLDLLLWPAMALGLGLGARSLPSVQAAANSVWPPRISLDAIHDQLVVVACLFFVFGNAWMAVVGWWRRLGPSSPGLAAGPRGLRIHGLSFSPTHLRWDEVGTITQQEGNAIVVHLGLDHPARAGLLGRFRARHRVHVRPEVQLSSALGRIKRLRAGEQEAP